MRRKDGYWPARGVASSVLYYLFASLDGYSKAQKLVGRHLIALLCFCRTLAFSVQNHFRPCVEQQSVVRKELIERTVVSPPALNIY